MILILLGPPGAGKGTQADLVSSQAGVVHVATGDLFRENLKNETEIGKKAKVYMDKGELVPDELTVRMLLDRIDQPDAQKGVLLDGFPRNIDQAKALDSALKDRGQSVDKVLNINVSEDEVVVRLGGRWTCRKCGAVYHQKFSPPKQAGICDKCGGEIYQRDDDKPETIRNRMVTFRNLTVPLIEYYKKQGKLVDVNGEQDAAAVGRELLKAAGLA